MRRVTLVTGATGFIGSYAVRRLVAEGEPVRVLVRCATRLEPDLRDRLDVVEGDIRDRDAVDRAVEGAPTVLHLAACARAWSRDPREFQEVNVRAVEMLLEAAERSGVERLVHVSSVLTLAPRRPAPLNGGTQRPTPYEATKRAGENLVESYAAAGRHAVIVHPTRVYGPGPLTDANAVTKAIDLYLRGRLRVRIADDDVQANYAHVADVAAGILLAARRGRRGAHYVLGGRDNVSFRQFLTLVGELSGQRRRVLPVPHSVALGLARAAVWWGRLGGDSPITPGWVRVLLEDRRVDVEPTCLALGYEPRALRQGLSETVAWLRARSRERRR